MVLLGAGLRIAGLGGASLWYDEGASLYLGHYVSEPMALFDSTKNSEPPLNPVMTGLWAGLLSTLSSIDPTNAANDFLLRLLPCFFGVLNIVLVYALTRCLFACEKTARIAALLFAIAPFQIYYAQELRVYSVYTTLSLGAVWCMARALADNHLRHWAGYVAALALLLYAHYFSMWLIFTLNVAFVALLPRHKTHFWRWTAANAVVMLLIAPALYRAFEMHEAVQRLEFPWYPHPTWKTGLITFKNFFAGYSPAAWAYWPLFALALTLWTLGMRWRGKIPDGVVLVVCLTWVPILGCVWVWGSAEFSFYEHRLFILSGVAALIGVARGVALLKRPGFAVLGLLVLLTLPALADHYRGRLHPIAEHRLGVFDKVDYRGAMRALHAQWEPGDRLIYANLFSAYPLFHYTKRDHVQIGWSPETETLLLAILGHGEIPRNHGLLPVPKEQAVAGATRIWYLRTHGLTFESQEFSERIQGWLESIAHADEKQHFKGLTLQCFTPKNR
jgi:hypothetical protein